MKWNDSIGAAIALTSVLQCCNVAAADSRTVNIHKAAEAGGAVEIENVAGTVEVTGWDRGEVEVTGTIGERVESVDVNTSPGHTTIRVVLPQRFWGSRGGSGDSADAALVVHVPRKSLLMATLVSAGITTRGLQGQQQLRTVSGSIDGELAHEAKINTISGHVKLAAGTGPLEVNSVSGTITVKGAAGEIRVGTVSGSADLELGAVTRAHFQTVSGAVSASGALGAGAELEATSVSGSLRFTLKGAADYDLNSFSGSIDNCFGPKAQRSGYGPGTHLVFREGDGNARVRLGTQSGSIQLCDHP
jgi:Putative adhesin